MLLSQGTGRLRVRHSEPLQWRTVWKEQFSSSSSGKAVTQEQGLCISENRHQLNFKQLLSVMADPGGTKVT